MKISNETKIGLLAVVGIALFYIGYNYLRGKGVFKHEDNLYAFYENIQGLSPSNPVIINGMQIGTVSSTDGGADMRNIKVTIRLTKDVNIPSNSVAIINPGLLGGKSLEIKLGTNTKYLKPGDTLLTAGSAGMIDDVLKTLDPVLYEVRNAVKSLDSVLNIIGTTFDPTTKNNIKQTMANLNATTASFAVSSVSLEKFLDPQAGHFAKLMNNMNAFTANLVSQNQKISTIMANTEKATGNLAAIDLQPTLKKLDATVNDLKAGIAKINSTEGSIGALLNDKKLYNNLTSTSNKINILLDDIRVHPKRYIPNISLIGGKKDKSSPLTAPLQDDSATIILK